MKSVLILLAIFFIVRALKKKLEDGKKEKPVPEAAPARESAPDRRPKAEEMVLDPVCGSYVPITVAIAESKGGKTVYFCSEECRSRF